jgi:hypothetical protein
MKKLTPTKAGQNRKELQKNDEDKIQNCLCLRRCSSRERRLGDTWQQKMNRRPMSSSSHRRLNNNPFSQEFEPAKYILHGVKEKD